MVGNFDGSFEGLGLGSIFGTQSSISSRQKLQTAHSSGHLSISQLINPSEIFCAASGH